MFDIKYNVNMKWMQSHGWNKLSCSYSRLKTLIYTIFAQWGFWLIIWILDKPLLWVCMSLAKEKAKKQRQKAKAKHQSLIIFFFCFFLIFMHIIIIIIKTFMRLKKNLVKSGFAIQICIYNMLICWLTHDKLLYVLINNIKTLISLL